MPEAFPSRIHKETQMIWETPQIEDIACGMEVTAYAPAGDERDNGDDLHTVPVIAAQPVEH